MHSSSEKETRAIAADLVAHLAPGHVVLLEGPLGAGKTAFVRGFLEALGYEGPVRSPTFNLIQTFDSTPPVMHADLYRLRDWQGIGLEDYLETHICFIEWPDRADGLVDEDRAWHVAIRFHGEGRLIDIAKPRRF